MYNKLIKLPPPKIMESWSTFGSLEEDGTPRWRPKLNNKSKL